MKTEKKPIVTIDDYIQQQEKHKQVGIEKIRAAI
jgi:hypothetical protein